MDRRRSPSQKAARITDYTVAENVEDGIFRWSPPLIEKSPRPKALYLNWRAFHVVFPDIPDPRSFPLLPTWPSHPDVGLYERYIGAAEELAESELLCGDDSMTVKWHEDSGESIETSFSSKEITRGFATLLRQFDAQGEEASFQRSAAVCAERRSTPTTHPLTLGALRSTPGAGRRVFYTRRSCSASGVAR